MEIMIMMFILVCTGAFFWGVTNIFDRHYMGIKKANLDVAVFATMLGAGLFALIFQFIILGVPKIQTGFWLPFFVSVFVLLGIRFGELKANITEDASIIAALLGLSPPFTIVIALILLGELPTIFGVAGIFLATFGIYALGISDLKSELEAQKNTQGEKIKIELPPKLKLIIPQKLQKSFLLYGAPFIKLFSSQGARLALLVAVLGAIGMTLGKIIVLKSSPFMLSASTFLAVAGITYVNLNIRKKWAALDKRFFWPLFGVGLIVGASSVLMDSGYLFGIVPYVAVLRRTMIIWTMIFAHIFLKEKITRWKILSVLAIIAGIILITF